MYKVFVNDKPIILTSSQIREENFQSFIFKNIAIREILHKIHTTKINGAYLHSDNLKEDWLNFCANFKNITAAGGLVENHKKQILFIYRGNRWDLPKGKQESKESIEETAIREVKEECGIENLYIDSFLLKTYHLFYDQNETKLKKTHWYKMKTNFSGKLAPQLKEKITKAVFKNKKQIQDILPYTYANIRMVYHAYKSQ